jgi:hypothetical protein
MVLWHLVSYGEELFNSCGYHSQQFFFSKVLFLLLGEKLQQLEEQKGIVIRFTIGHR